jgi:hypothetical protein
MDLKEPKIPDPSDFEKLDRLYEQGKGGLKELGATEEEHKRAYIEVGELVEKGTARFWDSSESFENLMIQTMDLEDVPKASKDEINVALAEGKVLLKKLDAVFRNSYLDMTPEEFAEIIQKENLSETLKEWARIYKRNIGLMIKNIKNYAPYFSPRIDLFLRTAELLKK